jgi:hypothetical protein
MIGARVVIPARRVMFIAIDRARRNGRRESRSTRRHRISGSQRGPRRKGATMRIVSGVAILAVTFSVACGNKSKTATTTPPAPTPTGTTAAGGSSGAGTGGGARAGGGATGTTGGATTAGGQRAGGAGAQAAARLTPDDLQARMRIIGPTSGALRMKLMMNQLPDAAKDAQTLAMAFGDVERFWQQNNKADAVMFAQTARMAATEAAGAAAAGDGMKALAAANTMQAQCKQCHGMYREGDAQTGFHIKPGVL